jgi:hypothetical protein
MDCSSVDFKLDCCSSIYEGLKKGLSESYQDGNKADPENFLWTVSLRDATFLPPDKLMIYHTDPQSESCMVTLKK